MAQGLSTFVIYVDGVGIELRVVAASERAAYQKAWSLLTDEQRDHTRCMDCIDELPATDAEAA